MKEIIGNDTENCKLVKEKLTLWLEDWQSLYWALCTTVRCVSDQERRGGQIMYYESMG